MNSRSFSGLIHHIILGTALLGACMQAKIAEEQQEVQIHLSELELQELFRTKQSYVYLGKEASEIANIIAEISKIDKNKESIVHALKDHIASGFSIANYDSVAQALDQANTVLAENVDTLEKEQADNLTLSLRKVIDQVNDEILNLDSHILSFMQDSVSKMNKDANRAHHKHSCSRLLSVAEKAEFCSKVTFKDDVKFKDNATFNGPVAINGTFLISGVRGTTTTNNDALPVLIDSTGQLGTISSSRRYKNNIQDMNDASASVLDLNPVTFVYNNDESNTQQFGLIAEEVETVFPEIVVKNAEGQAETVQYHILPVLLLNEMKKLAARVAVLEARL